MIRSDWTGYSSASTPDYTAVSAWTSSVSASTLAAFTEVENSFAGGGDGVPITPADSGGQSGDQFDWVQTDTGCAATYSTANPLRNAPYAKITQTAGGMAYLEYNISVGQLTAGQLFGRAYFRMPAWPDGTNGARIVAVTTSSNQFSAEWRVTSAGLVEQRSGSGTVQNTSSGAVPVGAWWRFQWAVLAIDTSAGQLECQTFTDADGWTPDETLTSAATLDTRIDLFSYKVGSLSGPTWATPTSWELHIADVDWAVYAYPGPSVEPLPGLPVAVQVG